MTIIISSGVTSSGLTVGGASPVTVLSGGTVSSSTVASGGTLSLSSGGIASAVTVAQGGEILGPGQLMGSSYDAGLVSGATVEGDFNTNAYLEIQSGGSAENLTVGGWYAYIQVDAGGEISGAQLSGSFEQLYGSASGTVLGYYGAEYVYAGVSTDAIVGSSGWQGVYGGVASGAQVSAGGEEYAWGGSVVGAVISSGGRLVLYSGGTATGVTVESGGEFDLPLIVSGGQTYVMTGPQTVSSPTSLQGVILESGARQGASSEVVQSGGTLSLGAGEIVTGVTVSSGGSLVGPGAIDNVNAGTNSYVAGLVSGVSIGANWQEGALEIGSGGTADNVIVGYGILTLDAGATASGLVVSGVTGRGEAHISGVASGDTVGSYGSEYVESGGKAIGTTVMSGGILVLHSGGTITGVTVDSGGEIDLPLVVSGGQTYVLSGSGIVSSPTALQGAVLEPGAVLGVATEVVQSGGTLSLGAGEVVGQVTVSSGGSLVGPGVINTVYPNQSSFAAGQVSGVTLGSGGYQGVLEIGSGGVADNVAVGYGTLTLDAGATASGLVISGAVGSAGVVISGVASGVTVGRDGFEDVESGGKTIGTTVLSGGVLSAASGATVSGVTVAAGGQLIGPAVLNGSALIEGQASGLQVAAGGDLVVETGATASGVTVSSGAALTLGLGATVSGLTVRAGAMIDFAGRATSAAVNASDQLVLTSGGVTVETIGLAGTSSSLDYSIVSGAGGTELVARTRPVATLDFAGEGMSDVLWRNTSTGQVGAWEPSSGGGAMNWVPFGTGGPGWTIAGVGDVNGDGAPDVFWQDTVGAQTQAGAWEMSPSGGFTWVPIGTGGAGWTIAGVGDFNDDGTSDILWQDTVGGQTQVGAWEMSAGRGYSWVSFGTGGSGWTIAGVGDFNGDGTSDILWQNTVAGQVQVGTWELSAAGGPTWVSFGTGGSGWTIAGVGDFNGDGKADILWQDTVVGQTQVGAWESSPGGGLSWVNFGTGGAGWTVAGVGDYDGDGKSDVLWRNASTGQMGTWESSRGGGVGSWVALGTFGSPWQPQS